MQANIIRTSFLMAYLTMLICMAGGVPFMTALFRSIIVLIVFSLIGFFLRWYLLKTVLSIEIKAVPGLPVGEEEPSDYGEESDETAITEDMEGSSLR